MRLLIPLFGIAMLTSATMLGADAAGKDLFAQKCKACHGPEGKGNPGIAKAMKVTMHSLGSKEVLGKSDDDLKKIILSGSGKMKPVAGVTAAQAGEIVTFVRTLKP